RLFAAGSDFVPHFAFADVKDYFEIDMDMRICDASGWNGGDVRGQTRRADIFSGHSLLVMNAVPITLRAAAANGKYAAMIFDRAELDIVFLVFHWQQTLERPVPNSEYFREQASNLKSIERNNSQSEIGSKPANISADSDNLLSGIQSQASKNLFHIARTIGYLCAASIASCDFHSETSMIVPRPRMIVGARSVTRPSLRNVGTRCRTSSSVSFSF